MPKDIVLHTKDAEITNVDMSLWQKVLDTLIDPNLIVLFMSLGTLGLIVELWNPGLIFPGTVGAICLILGLFGLQVLPISAAGLLLMLLAFAFFAAEAFVPTHGAITLAGAICFVIGAMLLFEPAGSTYQVSLPAVIAMAAAIAGLMGARRGQDRPGPQSAGRDRDERARRPGRLRARCARSGRDGLRARRALEGPLSDGPLERGAPVRIDSIDDELVLEVEPAEQPVPVT